MSLAVGVVSSTSTSKSMGFEENTKEGVNEIGTNVVNDKVVAESEIEDDGELEEVNKISRMMSESSIYATDHEEDEDDVEGKLQLGPQCTLKEQFEKDKVCQFLAIPAPAFYFLHHLSFLFLKNYFFCV